MERVLEAVSGFTNPFSSSFEDNELYFCLSVFLLSLAYLKILLRLMTLAGRLLQTSLTHFKLNQSTESTGGDGCIEAFK